MRWPPTRTITRREARALLPATSRAWLVAAGILAQVLWPAHGATQPALTLDRVLEQAIATHPDIDISRRSEDAHRADLIAAASPFELRLDSFVRSVDDRRRVTGDRTLSDTAITRVGTGVGLEKTLRFGPIIRSTLTLDSSTLGGAAFTSPGTFAADVAVTIPFSRDRGGAFSSAVEDAALRQYGGSQRAVRHTIASVAFEAASAYWSYLRAHRRLEAFQSSEQRAAQLVAETRVLIRADERPATDVHLMEANLAAKQTQRVLAGQQAVEAQHAVGLAMGLSLAGIVALPPPLTPFPEPATTPLSESSGFAARATEQALTHRQDLAAMREQSAASARLRDAAARQLRPRVDLNLSIDYSGDDIAVAQRLRRLGTSVELHYDRSASSDRRALALRSESAYLRDAVMVADLTRQIASRVDVAVSGWWAADGQLSRARETVRLARLGVESEKKNFQLGISTLFDAIQAEDALTNALLSEIDAQFAFATALVKVRFETGDLVTFDDAGAHIDWRRPFATAKAPRDGAGDRR